MKKISIKILFGLLPLLPLQQVVAQQKLNPATEQKIKVLVSRMTLEEKVGQMAQVSIEGFAKKGSVQAFEMDTAMLREAIVKYHIGSILNTPPELYDTRQWNTAIAQIQALVKQDRLQVPVLYGLDHIHGVTYVKGGTLFPQEIGQAATWNRKLVYDGAVITAYESRAAGVPWTFSPNLDLAVNPVWPRFWENFGEDPYLSGQLGIQFVKGVQEPLGSKEKLAVSLKHYMAYSDPKSGKDRTDAWIPEHYLREYHLPPYAAAIKAGARNVMVNSALINGIPTHMNKHLLTDILKNELGFTGFIVSDWQDIENIQRRDHIAATIKEAMMLSVNAGVDMSMIPYDYQYFCTNLVALVKEGKVAQSRIDDAVTRILRIKYELDLFNTPVTYASDYPKFASEEFARAAFNTAAESITLLKNNNGLLPIPKTARLLLTGPNANSMRTLNGGWTYTWQGDKTDALLAGKYNTILDALQNTFGKNNVRYEAGVSYKMNGTYDEDTVVNMEAVMNAAADADYIVLCVGENSYTETPGNLNDLSLTKNQTALVQALRQTNKPVIMVLNEGRPRIFRSVEFVPQAILQTYLPGNYGADALAAILTGEVNPSGKLPYTYPRYTNALTNYLHKPSDGADNAQGGEFDPQYEFGFGLSYTSFAYSNLQLSKTSVGPNETLTIKVDVQNTGSRAGKETVQLFVSDLLATLTPDVKRLRGFEKIELQPGATQTVTFQLPVKDLAFVHTDNKKHLEAGQFKVAVGKLTATFNLTMGIVFK